MTHQPQIGLPQILLVVQVHLSVLWELKESIICGEVCEVVQLGGVFDVNKHLVCLVKVQVLSVPGTVLLLTEC